MIETVFSCDNCGVSISHWSEHVDLEPVDECPFCESKECRVYISDDMPTSDYEQGDVVELLKRVSRALSYDPDPFNFP